MHRFGLGILLLTLVTGCPPLPSNNQNNNGSANDNASGNANANVAANENLNFNAPPAPTGVTLTQVVQTGDGVPGQAEGAAFTSFGNPIIDAEGRVAFWAQYQNGTGHGGLYVWHEGTLQAVVDDDPNERGIVPGRTTQDYFGNLQSSSTLSDPLSLPLTWGSAGRLTFGCPIAGESESKGIFRWRFADGELSRMFDLEQLTAKFSAEFGTVVLDWTLEPVTASNDGVVFVAVRYTLLGTGVPGQIAFGTGVCRSDGATLVIIADRFLDDGGVPGQGVTSRFTAFGEAATQNLVGDGLFQASYSNGLGTRGLYLARGADLFLVLDNRPSATFVGLPAGSTVGGANAFASAVAASDTHIVLDTQLQVGSQTRNTIVLWSWARRRWTEIVGGDAANAETLLTGVTRFGQFAYLADGRPHISNGQRVFRLDSTLPSPLSSGTLRWEPSGSISTFGRALLRYTRNPSSATDSAAGLALWTGAGLLVVADRGASQPSMDVATVSIASAPEGNRPGHSGAINDTDEFAFRLTRLGADGQGGTTDDTQAIFFGVANP